MTASGISEMTSGVTVRLAPLQPHCFAFGGFEIQMLAALEAARNAGTSVSRLDPWDRDQRFHILHLWGLDLMHHTTVQWARRANKRLVLTVLLPYLTPRQVFRSTFSWFLPRAVWRRRLAAEVDALVVVNRAQCVSARVLLRKPASRVHVVPNIVPDIFFEAAAEGGNRDYVLCAGNICRRKNQLKLIQASVAAGLKVVLIGGVLPGEEKYAEQIRKVAAASPLVEWRQEVPPGSAALADLYAHARVFALVSLLETQPISMLEAAAAGCRLVTANRPYARQEFYRGAELVDPNSVAAIQAGLTKAFRAGGAGAIEQRVLEPCRRQSVGRAYKEIYETVARGGDRPA